jgi:mRNA-degrading endonuclease RelE of RelBE toxin-antitoxin system
LSEDAAPRRISVIWSAEARADLRAIERSPAIQILHCVDHYLASRSGSVKKLKPPFTGFRLRCSDYRVFFDLKDETPSKSPLFDTGARPTDRDYR